MAHNSIKSKKFSNLCPEQIQKHGDNQQETECNRKFLEWFIGFVEGDGCFYVTRGKPVFSIHLHKKDLSLLYEIQSFLGNIGSVSSNRKTKKAIFLIKAKKDIFYLISIFNGNLFLTKKKERFQLWVNAFNKYNGFDIKVKQCIFVPTLNNGWISGFTDAEGCFAFIRSKKRSQGNTYKNIQRYVLSQKDSKEELIFLTSLLKGYVEKSTRCDRLVINFSELDHIINYLEIYPLRSSKNQSFTIWKAIWSYRKKLNNYIETDNQHLNILKKALNDSNKE